MGVPAWHLTESEKQKMMNKVNNKDKHMTKEFKKGDKVYYIELLSGDKVECIVNRIEGNMVWFSNYTWIDLHRIAHVEEHNPFKNITTPIYTLDTISEACFDYMQSYDVGFAYDPSLRECADNGIVYIPHRHELFCSPSRGGQGVELSKEEFYKAIGFTENNNETKRENNMPLFGNELINKYRK